MADAFTSDTYDALCQEAEGYLARGLAEQARELLLKAASLIGTRPKARSLLADACMSLGLWEEARAQLETLTTLEIDNFHNHFRLGQVLEELGENQLARDNYSVVLEHNTDHHGARVAISRLENTDETPDVNLASFFASGGAGEDAEEVQEATDTDATDSGEVVESVFGSTQVFPDDSGSDDVFAGEEDVERGIDKLLKDLGVEGDTQETSGAVSELLESLGIQPDGDEDEVKEALQKVDIASLLGGDDDAQTAAAVREVTAGVEQASADGTAVLESVFAAEPAEEEEAAPEEPVPVAEIIAEETSDAGVLESVFIAGEAVEEIPAVETAVPAEPEVTEPEGETEEPAAEAEPAAVEAEPVEALSEVGMLDSIFGAPAVEEPAAEVEEPVVTGPETLITEEIAPAPAPAEEETEVTEPEGEAEAPAAPEPEAAEEEPVSAEPSGEEAATVETPAEEVTEGPEPDGGAEGPAAEETEALPSEPEVEPETVPTEPEAVPAEAAAPVGRASFIVHRPDSDTLVTVELQDGTVAVRQAFVVAMSRTLTVDADEEGRRLVKGKGTIWLGQGERVPVSIGLSDGMYARSDKMVLFDAGIGLDPVELPGVPSMVKLRIEENSEVLFFASGRMRELDLPAGASLQVRAASLLAAGGDVEITADPDSADFLTLSGSGRIDISG